ncbi:MAG: hypothetical protein RLZZ324_776 [Candidatus Parcubacteria bacterium]
MTAITPEELEWDAFAIANGGCFLQSWGWSEFQESRGRKVFRMRLGKPDAAGALSGNAGDAVAQAVNVTHELPFGRTYIYIPRGPVVKLEDGHADAGRIHLETCVAALKRKSKEEGAIFTRVEWQYVTGVGPVSREDLKRWGFVQAKSMQPSDTVIMYLAKTEDEMQAAMHQKTRYNIRVAEKRGVTVRYADPSNPEQCARDVRDFLDMLAETASRDEFHTHAPDYYRDMLSALPANGEGALKIRLALAEVDGAPAAGALIASYGDTWTYLHGASVAAKRQAMAPFKLHWTVIRDAKAAGARAYDFWGVAPSDDEKHPWAGITRFKTGFGGTRVSYLGAWELPVDAFWYTLYRYAKRFRNL